ncbi:hypothetical protein [Streptomyces sp. NPDC001020]
MLELKLPHRHAAAMVTPARRVQLDLSTCGMTSTFHQEHPDAALARAPTPPKLINITPPVDQGASQADRQVTSLLLDKAKRSPR